MEGGDSRHEDKSLTIGTRRKDTETMQHTKRSVTLSAHDNLDTQPQA